MLSRKNKDLRTIKEGVVGKYVKKDTPPEMPSKRTKLLLKKKKHNLYKFRFSHKRLVDRT